MSTTAIIAESLPLFRRGLVQLLELDLGMTVVEVITDADQILPAQRALRPALAVIDRDIPGRDVFEILRAARRSSPGTRSILLASRLSDTDLDRGLAAGVSGFALKSDDVEELTRAFRSALEGRLGVTPEVATRLTARSEIGRSSDNATSLLAQLTERELEILGYVARGMTVREIANLIAVSPKTVDSHKTRVMSKLQIHNRARLTLFAISEGLIRATVGGRSVEPVSAGT